MHKHCSCIHGWHYKPYCFILSRTNSAKNIGIFKLLLTRKTRPRTSFRPCTCNCASLSYPSFILEPNINSFYFDPLWQYLDYFISEVFLKASWVSKSALGWIERPVIHTSPARFNVTYTVLKEGSTPYLVVPENL